MEDTPHNIPYPVVVFDDMCFFCNGFAQFILKRDTNVHYHFAPLTGTTMQAFLQQANQQPVEAMYLLRSPKKYYIKSGAVLRIVASVSWYWRWVLIFLIVPSFIRDGVYDSISARRNALFNKNKNTCPVFPPEYTERLLP